MSLSFSSPSPPLLLLSLLLLLAQSAQSVTTEPPNASLLRLHGRLMIIAWSCVLPVGIIWGRLVQAQHASPSRYVARSRAMLSLHALVQTAGVAIVAAALTLVIRRLKDGIPAIHKIKLHHGDVGISAVALLFAQWLNGVLLRPHQGVSVRRIVWEHWHTALGRFALTLGVVNIFTGVTIARDFGVITQTSFNIWTGLAASSLGFWWWLGAAAVKACDQKARADQIGGAEGGTTATKRSSEVRPEPDVPEVEQGSKDELPEAEVQQPEEHAAIPHGSEGDVPVATP